MNTIEFETVIDRSHSLSIKWDRNAIASICNNPDAEPFWVADMDWQAPSAVLEASKELAEHGIYGYSTAPNQRQIFCSWVKERHQMDLRSSDVVISQGVLTSLATLVEILSAEGDSIIVGLPAYQPFLRIVNNHKRSLLSWPLSYDWQSRQFSLDWKALEALLPKARLLIFCSPHNPTGLTFSRDELFALTSLCAKHQVTIISDEIHADLAFEPHHCLLDAARHTACNAVVLMAPSKTFNIAGEHYSATLFSDPEVRDLFIKRRDQLYGSSPSTTAMTMAMAAYQKGGPWLKVLVDHLREEAQFVEHYLFERAPLLSFIAPQASFIALIDCSRIIRLVEQDAILHPELYDAERSPQGGLLSRFFGQRANVAMNDGSWFGGEEYRRFVRFNYAAPRSRLVAALDQMATAVEELKKRYN